MEHAQLQREGQGTGREVMARRSVVDTTAAAAQQRSGGVVGGVACGWWYGVWLAVWRGGGAACGVVGLGLVVGLVLGLVTGLGAHSMFDMNVTAFWHRGVSMTYTMTVGTADAKDSVTICPEALHVKISIWPGVSTST